MEPQKSHCKEKIFEQGKSNGKENWTKLNKKELYGTGRIGKIGERRYETTDGTLQRVYVDSGKKIEERTTGTQREESV